MELLTARLRVRRFCPQDEAALHAILSDPAVMVHLEPPFSPAQTASFLRSAGLCPQPAVWAVEQRFSPQPGNALAGYLIFHLYPGTDDWELGWVLGQTHWGQGYAAELTAAVIAHARQQRLAGLVLECVPAQTATRRLAARFGFDLTGQTDGLLQFRLPLG